MVRKTARMETRDMGNENVQRQFGRRVHALRKKKGLTQEQLAEAIGKSVDTISNIERGFSSTRIKTAEVIANVLGVTVADLFLVSPTTGEETHHRQFMNRVDKLTKDCASETLDAVIQAIEAVTKVAERN